MMNLPFDVFLLKTYCLLNESFVCDLSWMRVANVQPKQVCIRFRTVSGWFFWMEV